MATLSKQQVSDIIKNAPQGTSPAGIVAALRSKGHVLEGYPIETPVLDTSSMERSKLVESTETPGRTVRQYLNPQTGEYQSEREAGFGQKLAAATEFFVDPIAKFINSAVKAPVDIVRSILGKAPLEDIDGRKLPSGKKSETIQREFATKTLPAVEAGTRSPLGATADVVAQTVGGAADAFGTGAIVEKALSKSVAKTATTELAKLADTTAGVADKAARISALEKSGMPGGAKSSLTGGIEITPDSRAFERAKSVQGIIKTGADPVQNLQNLNREITRVSEKEILPALQKAKPFTPISDKTPGWSKIVKRLSSIEKPDIIKADATLDKTYELVRKRMIDQIKKQPATAEGLWNARKNFDKVVQDQFGDVVFDSEKNTAIKRAISDLRRAVNDEIASMVPEYADQMKRLSNMYDARYNLAEQFQYLVDKGGWTRYKTLNPAKAKLLKWGALTTIGTIATKELTGL